MRKTIYNKALIDAKYYQENRTAILKKKKAKYCSETQKKNARNYTAKWKKFLFTRLGNKCKNCGFSDVRALQLDHIHGGGYRVKVNGRRVYRVYYRQLSLAPDTEKFIQILCANCNWIKRCENNESSQWISV